jgi:hypothetical protein
MCRFLLYTARVLSAIIILPCYKMDIMLECTLNIVKSIMKGTYIFL